MTELNKFALKSGGGGTYIGGTLPFVNGLPKDITVNKQRYLKSGSIILDKSKYDNNFWKGTTALLKGGRSLPLTSFTRGVGYATDGTTVIRGTGQNRQVEISTDYINWKPVMTSVPVDAVMSTILYHDGTFYASTYLGAYVAKSTDSGATWTNCAVLTSSTSITTMAISDSGILLVMSSDGSVQRSVDKGVTWASAQTIANTPIDFLKWVQKSPTLGDGYFVAAGYSQRYVYTTKTAAVGTWTRLNSVLQLNPIRSAVLGSRMYFLGSSTSIYYVDISLPPPFVATLVPRNPLTFAGFSTLTNIASDKRTNEFIVLNTGGSLGNGWFRIKGAIDGVFSVEKLPVSYLADLADLYDIEKNVMDYVSAIGRERDGQTNNVILQGFAGIANEVSPSPEESIYARIS